MTDVTKEQVLETLKTVRMPWTTTADYMDAIEKRLGINVGCLVGHTAVRQYVMGSESQGRPATADEIAKMQALVRDGVLYVTCRNGILYALDSRGGKERELGAQRGLHALP